RFSYSDDGYCLLAMILEKAAGIPFEKVMEREVFAPAGMHDTRCWGDYDDSYKNRLAHAPQEKRDLNWKANWGRRGATGVLTTAGDLYRLSRALGRDDYLSPELRRRVFRPRVKTDRTPEYAYGWFVSTADGKPVVIQHGGLEDGVAHTALLRMYPQEKSAII